MAFELPVDSNNLEQRRNFYAKHIFHERQMNSCPIGCEGCAVSASTTNPGAIALSELTDMYKEAQELGVKMQITKVEGYDPAFVRYSDDQNGKFADSLKTAIDCGHSIITPVCTTGSWNGQRTIEQIAALGKLPDHYRNYTYPSGRTGTGYVLSIPREIRQFQKKGYKFEEHIEKLHRDLSLLSVGGKVQALIYFNSKINGDAIAAEQIKTELSKLLTEEQKAKVELIITEFSDETTPESCYRYENSILVADDGFHYIDPVVMDWDMQPAHKNPFIGARPAGIPA